RLEPSGVPPSALKPVERRERLPLSFAQERLWFLDQLEGAGPAYNICAGACLTGDLDVSALERSLAEIVRRHEALRTNFVGGEGRPLQIVREPRPLLLDVVDFSRLHDPERSRKVEQYIRSQARRPFDLARGDLLRVSLVKIGSAEHIFLLTVH